MKKITYQTGDTHLADCYGDIYPIPGTKGVCILKIDGGSTRTQPSYRRGRWRNPGMTAFTRRCLDCGREWEEEEE